MSLTGVFNRRVRGFRVVEVAGLCILLTEVTGVYLAKTFAGRERAQISDIERQIEDEAAQKRLLEAEVAYLEQPRMIERRAIDLGLQLIPPTREITEEDLIDVARRREPAKPVTLTPPPTDPAALAADAPEPVPGDEPGSEAPR